MVLVSSVYFHAFHFYLVFCMQFDTKTSTLWFGGSSKELQNNQNDRIYLPSEGLNAICLMEECILVASWDSKVYSIHQKQGNVQEDSQFLTTAQYPINCMKLYSQVCSIHALVQKERELLVTGSKSGIICIYELDK